jgi:hypothetical protein
MGFFIMIRQLDFFSSSLTNILREKNNNYPDKPKLIRGR